MYIGLCYICMLVYHLGLFFNFFYKTFYFTDKCCGCPSARLNIVWVANLYFNDLAQRPQSFPRPHSYTSLYSLYI